MSLPIVLHVLSAVVWVGGMFFAYVALRPVAATVLDGPQRLTLWSHVFQRFFPWVWLSVVLLFVTGFWMLYGYFGGMRGAAAYIHLMLALGFVMSLLFLYIFFAPYQGLKRAVADGDWAAGAAELARIRRTVAVNTLLGIVVVGIATGGPYLLV